MLNGLLDQIKNAIFNDPSTPHRQGYDPSGLIGQIEGLFGQHQQQQPPQGYGQPQGMNVRPASEDPYGDPADQFPVGNQGNFGYLQGRNIRPASEDPLGDPADQEGYGR